MVYRSVNEKVSSLEEVSETECVSIIFSEVGLLSRSWPSNGRCSSESLEAVEIAGSPIKLATAARNAAFQAAGLT